MFSSFIGGVLDYSLFKPHVEQFPVAFTGVRARLRASPVFVPFPYLVISDKLLASFCPDRLVEAPRSHAVARKCDLM